MRAWSYYNLKTGRLTGRQGSSTADVTPRERAGEAVVDGHHDPATRCVELSTGAVVDCAPLPPTPAQVRERERGRILAEIQRLEAGQARALREAVLTDDKGRLDAIDASIATLRAELGAVSGEQG